MKKIHFKEALEGLVFAFKKEKNFKTHLIVAFVVILFGFYFKLKIEEWSVLVLTMAYVLSMEVINTSIETFTDYFSGKRKNETVKVIKDVSAAAVLTSVLVAIVIGLLIFVPKIIVLII